MMYHAWAWFMNFPSLHFLPWLPEDVFADVSNFNNLLIFPLSSSSTVATAAAHYAAFRASQTLFR